MIRHESFWLLWVNTAQSELLFLVKFRCEGQKSSFLKPEDTQEKVIGHQRLSYLVLHQTEQLVKRSLQWFALLVAFLNHFGSHRIHIGLDLARHGRLAGIKDKA